MATMLESTGAKCVIVRFIMDFSPVADFPYRSPVRGDSEASSQWLSGAAMRGSVRGSRSVALAGHPTPEKTPAACSEGNLTKYDCCHETRCLPHHPEQRRQNREPSPR